MLPMSETNPCPCGSGLSLNACCKPLIDGTAKAPTAEALMRSRYTAYTLQDISYLASTLDPNQLRDFDRDATADWAQDSTWMGLEIVSTSAGSSDDKDGSVEFKARYARNGVTQEHHEVSRFRKFHGTWLYIGGKEVGPAQFKRDAPKTGRNEPCPCGSGKKYKKCCGK
jgi:SEC-C motif-containing protein